MEAVAERGIIGSEGGEDARMIDRLAERCLQFANPRNDARVHQSAEILEAIRLIEQRAEFAQQLNVLFWKHRNIRLGEDLEERNFKWRERNGPVQSIAAALPLARHARVTIEEGYDQIGLVAIGSGVVTMAREISQESL